MLLELHVRNLALIEKADITFYPGLTILSGETGAGKSILIDSMNIALGAKFSKDMIRTGSEQAWVELVFLIEDFNKAEALKELGVELEENHLLILSRKVNAQRSIIKINDETATLGKLRAVTQLLVDIHGQHEHQSLLKTTKHLEILDLYGGKEIAYYKEKVEKSYQEYKPIILALNDTLDESIRIREIEILRYEIQEIENANLKAGEEEEILSHFRKLKNIAKIRLAMDISLRNLEGMDVTEAIRELKAVQTYDISLLDMIMQLENIEALLSDTLAQFHDYTENLEFDEKNFKDLEERLEIIHHIQSKYGGDIEDLQSKLEQKKERLAYLENYDITRKELWLQKEKWEQKLLKESENLSKARKEIAKKLEKDIIKELKDLNFLWISFTISLERIKEFGISGIDHVEFRISTNPGQPLKPLKDVLSGGELSRIMLAIKTVLADMDAVETLIFDEVDAGISGRTAQKVSEKLTKIARYKQVLCITHLPQIAAMADIHYLISKYTDGIQTKTLVEKLEEEEITKELARLLGGSEITKAVLNTAREMKQLANQSKFTRRN